MRGMRVRRRRTAPRLSSHGTAQTRSKLNSSIGITWSVTGGTTYGPSTSCDNGTVGPYPSTCNSGSTTWNAPDSPVGTYTYQISSTVTVLGWPWSSYPTGDSYGRYSCLPTYYGNNTGVLVCYVYGLAGTY